MKTGKPWTAAVRPHTPDIARSRKGRLGDALEVGTIAPWTPERGGVAETVSVAGVDAKRAA